MGGTGHRLRPCWGPLVVQGPTASDGHSPILQDPLPWQQKVRFAKGIASGMVSLGTNLASRLAGEEGGWQLGEMQGLQAGIRRQLVWAGQLVLSCSLCQ